MSALGRKKNVAFVSQPVFNKDIEVFVFSVEYQVRECHSKQLFLCRTLEKPPKKTQTPQEVLLHVINSSRAQGDMRICNISIRNPQDRVSSKTWTTRSCWFRCCNYFVIFATGQGFHLVCRMHWRAVCWGFRLFCLFACSCGGVCGWLVVFFSLLL